LPRRRINLISRRSISHLSTRLCDRPSGSGLTIYSLHRIDMNINLSYSRPYSHLHKVFLDLRKDHLTVASSAEQVRTTNENEFDVQYRIGRVQFVLYDNV
jgi:hypothetical protein